MKKVLLCCALLVAANASFAAPTENPPTSPIAQTANDPEYIVTITVVTNVLGLEVPVPFATIFVNNAAAATTNSLGIAANVKLRQGDILALPAGVVHWIYNEGDGLDLKLVLLDVQL
ncbi:cupin domain-containing protein [Chitinophaga sp. Cy-1792]|uniref:cupin domain-containing protein n=1 Tax=Chitinophaga sp. Cy-1792 TaxID=2608339 RepID=UPI001423C689|nr:cupin domain-containing protein [Chitinophaga sp. Cy-1792]NIG56531.1 hypothetical protein [Chitinophaga sp. Cy-1792]